MKEEPIGGRRTDVVAFVRVSQHQLRGCDVRIEGEIRDVNIRIRKAGRFQRPLCSELLIRSNAMHFKND